MNEASGGLRLIWQPRTDNAKTGDVPTAYVGTTVDECRSSCAGCPLLDRACYAWAGRIRLTMARMEQHYLRYPETCSLENAIESRHPGARVVRISALGDPARARPEEVLDAATAFALVGLATIAYTHFWRDPGASHLRLVCLASCQDEAEAEEAIELGWKPATILVWDHQGKTFRLPRGGLGIVCPAQIRETTCNQCRLCWARHPAWKRIQAIGFLDHSRAAHRESRRFGEGQLALFDARPDTRPGGSGGR